MKRTPKEFSLSNISGGLNLRSLPYRLQDTQSPDMQNMWFHDRVLSKRWGQEYALPELSGCIWSISQEYEGAAAIHAGTKLYRWDVASGQVSEIAVGIADREGLFLEFDSLLYHLDGSEIRVIAQDYTVSAITPHMPVVYTGCAPDFTACTAKEAYNLLCPGFIVRYNGNGVQMLYLLPLQGLDSAPVGIRVGGVALTEGMHFTVDRTEGTVDFTGGTLPWGAPAPGIDNVEVTAFKTAAGAKRKIAGCMAGAAFGGESGSASGGTRVFLSRNGENPRTLWYSDAGGGLGRGMAYFPVTQCMELIQNNDAVTAFGKQAGELIVFKERSIFILSYESDGREAYYPIREFHASVGCDIPNSVQLIDSRLVFANTAGGVFMITGTGEGNRIRPLSGNVNGSADVRGLLKDGFDVEWTEAEEAWSYRAPFSLAAAGDRTGKYRKGDKFV